VGEYNRGGGGDGEGEERERIRRLEMLVWFSNAFNWYGENKQEGRGGIGVCV